MSSDGKYSLSGEEIPHSSNFTDLSESFLTRKQHVQVRTCGKLLCALDNVVGRSSGQSASATSANAARPRLFEYILSAHCNIPVRRPEVLAVTVSGKRVNPTADALDGIGEAIDPRIVIAANPRANDYDKKSTGKRDEYKVIVTQIDIDDSTTALNRLIATLLKRTCDAPKNKVPLAKHVKSYFHHLRAVHAATSADKHAAAVDALKDYVHATSFPKMIMRFNNGSKEARDHSVVNFWEILMREEAFPEHAPRVSMPIHLQHKKPNPEQASLIGIALRGLGAESTLHWKQADMYDTPSDRTRF